MADFLSTIFFCIFIVQSKAALKFQNFPDCCRRPLYIHDSLIYPDVLPPDILPTDISHPDFFCPEVGRCLHFYMYICPFTQLHFVTIAFLETSSKCCPKNFLYVMCKSNTLTMYSTRWDIFLLMRTQRNLQIHTQKNGAT